MLDFEVVPSFWNLRISMCGHVLHHWKTVARTCNTRQKEFENDRRLNLVTMFTTAIANFAADIKCPLKLLPKVSAPTLMSTSDLAQILPPLRRV